MPTNPRRMSWAEVPDAVVARIEGRAGSAVASAAGSEFGFSPGFAGVVNFADGSRVFLKVMSGVRDPWSIAMNRREVEVLSVLPSEISAPALLWTVEEGDWLVLAAEAVEGEHPRPAENPHHAAAIWDGLSHLATVRAPANLPAFHDYQADVFTQWATLAEAPDRAERIATFGGHGEWIAEHLDDLVAWEREGIEVSKGDALVHGDLRDDNLLLVGERLMIVDWPHASRGAPWIDLVGYLPSFEMFGGGIASEAFRAHPLSKGVTGAEERALVAGLAGYFTVGATDPPMPALPGLREFQRAQAVPALNWLRRLAD